MTADERRYAAETMNSLPFVKWDRFVEIPDGDVDVYGWIPRDDGRADFVHLTFPTPIEPGYVGYTTSSAKFSAEIARILFGSDEGHVDCERVDGYFGDLVINKVVRT